MLEELAILEEFPILRLPGAARLIEDYNQTHSPLCDSPSLCFDLDYWRIAGHLRRLRGVESVVDIGAAFGTQSLFFQGYRYIGVDSQVPCGGWGTRDTHEIPFFQAVDQDVRFLVATFPEPWPCEAKGDIFISNLALGYGSKIRDFEKAKALLRGFRGGYFKGPENVFELIATVFDQHYMVYDNGIVPLYFFGREEFR